MIILKYIPIIILFYISLKLLIKFIDENTLILKSDLEKQKKHSNMLSFHDLPFNDSTKFITAINLYFKNHSICNIVKNNDSTQNLINYLGVIDNDKVYISCIQNITPDTYDDSLTISPLEDVQRFLGRMLKLGYTKGILINTSIFSNESIKFINTINSCNTVEVKLINGYELTKFIRTDKNSNIPSEVY